MIRLSEHFTLDEMTFSQTAARQGIDNTPSRTIITNLTDLCVVLEEVRELLAAPLLISSGYRSPPLNASVGGSANSRHVLGLAVDFTAPKFGAPLAVAKAIAESDIQFDQVIHEFGRWVHLGLAAPGEKPRRRTLTIRNASEGYLPGLK